MPVFFWLLVMYGLMFGLANKVPFLHGKSKFTDRLLSCPYCLGFHAGWLAWLLAWQAKAAIPSGALQTAAEILSWALASSTLCYILDTWVQKLEKESARLGK